MIGDDLPAIVAARHADAIDEADRAVARADAWGVLRDLVDSVADDPRPMFELTDAERRLTGADRHRFRSTLARLAELIDEPDDDPTTTEGDTRS